MAKKQSLGRGFDALIPKGFDNTILSEDKNRVQKLLIQDIVPNPDQPRREHQPEQLNELTESVKLHGVLQPIIVVRHNRGYRIVAGERRWRAAKAAKLNDIPAIVRSLAELEQVELALIENIQRVDLSPLEQAVAVYKLQQQFNLQLEKIAEKLGKAPSTVSNLARLLQLPEESKEALRMGKITEGHARAILALKGHPDKQKQLLRSILNNGWSVRRAENFVNASKSPDSPKNTATKSVEDSQLANALGKKLNTKVTIRPSGVGGKVEIHYNNEQKLADLSKKLLN